MEFLRIPPRFFVIRNYNELNRLGPLCNRAKIVIRFGIMNKLEILLCNGLETEIRFQLPLY